MIGIDIVDVRRFVKFKKDDFARWRHVFTRAEWQYCFKKSKPAECLAGLFSAKEAVVKALGIASSHKLNLLEILHNIQGKPVVKIRSKKKLKAEISISHDAGNAVAVAIRIT